MRRYGLLILLALIETATLAQDWQRTWMALSKKRQATVAAVLGPPYTTAAIRLWTNALNASNLWVNTGTESGNFAQDSAAVTPAATATSYVFTADALTGTVSAVMAERSNWCCSLWFNGTGVGDLDWVFSLSAGSTPLRWLRAQTTPIDDGWTPPLTNPCVYYGAKVGASYAYRAGELSAGWNCVQVSHSAASDGVGIVHLYINAREWINGATISSGIVSEASSNPICLGGFQNPGLTANLDGTLEDVMFWVGTNIPTLGQLGLIYSNGANYGGD